MHFQPEKDPKMKRLLLLFPLLLLAACQQASMSTDPSAIMDRSAAWQTAMNDGDVDALVAIYSDDARLMPPNAPMSESPGTAASISAINADSMGKGHVGGVGGKCAPYHGQYQAN